MQNRLLFRHIRPWLYTHSCWHTGLSTLTRWKFLKLFVVSFCPCSGSKVVWTRFGFSEQNVSVLSSLKSPSVLRVAFSQCEPELRKRSGHVSHRTRRCCVLCKFSLTFIPSTMLRCTNMWMLTWCVNRRAGWVASWKIFFFFLPTALFKVTINWNLLRCS